MPRPRPAAKPAKKGKTATPSTTDDFQELADEEEARGGKWRAGDIAKSARAFQRALTFYDEGLKQFPTDFDLTYNKARLLLEVSQQPALLPHFGLSHADFLAETLLAHRRALVLNDGEVDLLFNTAQVLTSLAEEMSEHDRDAEAIPLLHETLELLSSCLAKQEMQLEQQTMDPDDSEEDGGVPVGEADASPDDNASSEEVAARVIEPVSALDLLDTLHASLSALTTLVPLEREAAVTNLGAMAQTLSDTKAPAYVALLPAEDQPAAHLAVRLDRAVFIAALANARYSFHDMDLKTYSESLSEFNIAGKESNAQALSSEAEAKTEFVLSALDALYDDSSVSVADCWRQLSQTQDLLSQASKLESDDAKELRPELYKQKGDVELLRVRIASLTDDGVTATMRNSGPALLKNARTFYKAAIGFASTAGDDAVTSTASDRLGAVQFLIDLDAQPETVASHGLSTVFASIAEEGLIDDNLLNRISAMLT